MGLYPIVPSQPLRLNQRLVGLNPPAMRMGGPDPQDWRNERDLHETQRQPFYTIPQRPLTSRDMEQERPYPHAHPAPRLHLPSATGQQLPPRRVVDRGQSHRGTGNDTRTEEEWIIAERRYTR